MAERLQPTENLQVGELSLNSSQAQRFLMFTTALTTDPRIIAALYSYSGSSRRGSEETLTSFTLEDIATRTLNHFPQSNPSYFRLGVNNLSHTPFTTSLVTPEARNAKSQISTYQISEDAQNYLFPFMHANGLIAHSGEEITRAALADIGHGKSATGGITAPRKLELVLEMLNNNGSINAKVKGNQPLQDLIRAGIVERNQLTGSLDLSSKGAEITRLLVKVAQYILETDNPKSSI